MGAVRPKKQLGQHFLKDKQIAERIVDSFLTVFDGDLAIEIGPGTGVLTDHLIQVEDFNFKALDVDRESVDYLHKNYPDQTSKVLFEDFLKTNLIEGFERVGVIGNFPYNISSQIFFKIYEEKDRVELVVGMLQKEVAERICAKPRNKTYGILSVLLQAFYEVEYLFTVKPGVFDPPPKVMSAVIRLRRNDTKTLDCDQRLFKRVVKEGFQKRRKTLRNALKIFDLSKDLTTEEVFSQRAEELSVAEFVELTKKIEADGRKNSI